MKSKFKGWQTLTELGYFKRLGDGRLELTVPGIDGIKDFHTHLGWTLFYAPPVDINRETAKVNHFFEPGYEVDINIYSGQNIFENSPNWGYRNLLPVAFSPFRMGKHHTHTIPNLIKEMDALKIDQSVVLGLDLIKAFNSRRQGEAIRFNPRLIYYCMIHPLNPWREKLIDEYLRIGARGMKIHPELQLASVDSPKVISMIKLWQKKSGGLPVLAHSGFNGYEPKKAREKADMKHYWKFAAALEGSPCILGHSGMNNYREAIRIAQKYDHVYLEIGGQPPAHLKELIETVGPDRLLFGSDWPFYPQALPLAKVLLTTEDYPEARHKILKENARKLLGD